jgi:hypothetical protein
MSDDESKRPEDPDRAAILARRQHFIAIALSGLATTTACASTGDSGTGGTKEAEKKGQSEAPPEPCLSVALPPENAETETGAPPQPCLKVAPPDEQTEEGETGKPAEPAPEPCLKVAPRPCLKKAAPKPCLNVPPPSE